MSFVWIPRCSCSCTVKPGNGVNSCKIWFHVFWKSRFNYIYIMSTTSPSIEPTLVEWWRCHWELLCSNASGTRLPCAKYKRVLNQKIKLIIANYLNIWDLQPFKGCKNNDRPGMNKPLRCEKLRVPSECEIVTIWGVLPQTINHVSFIRGWQYTKWIMCAISRESAKSQGFHSRTNGCALWSIHQRNSSCVSMYKYMYHNVNLWYSQLFLFFLWFYDEFFEKSSIFSQTFYLQDETVFVDWLKLNLISDISGFLWSFSDFLQGWWWMFLPLAALSLGRPRTSPMDDHAGGESLVVATWWWTTHVHRFCGI